MSKLFAAALIRILGATLLVLGSNAICQDAEWRRSIDAGTAAMNKHETLRLKVITGMRSVWRRNTGTKMPEFQWR
jgi:hypothetical protein